MSLGWEAKRNNPIFNCSNEFTVAIRQSQSASNYTEVLLQLFLFLSLERNKVQITSS